MIRTGHIFMCIKRWLIISLIFSLILGCDNAKESSKAPNSSTARNGTVVNQSTPQKPIDEVAVAKRYKDKKLSVVDVSELQVNGVSTLSITFSVPLKANQDFATKLHLVDTISGKVDGGWELSKNQQELRLSHLEPKRKLILTIESGLEAVNDNVLSKEHISRFETRDLQPMLGFTSRGSLFPVRLAEGLPVFTSNVDKVTINFFRIKPTMLPEFLEQWNKSTSLRNWQSEELLPMADLVYTGGFNLNPEKNTKETVLLPIAGIKQLQEAGVFFAVMQQTGTYNYSNPATMFTVSDIGLSAHKFQQNDNVAVFTQALEGGKPLAGIDLQVLDAKGKVIAEAKTDAKGYAEIINVPKARVILAKKDTQTTMLRLSSSALDLSEFAISGVQDAPYQFFVFGPRDLYRPGETIVFNALLRDKDGQLAKDMPVNVEVKRPDGATVRSFIWKSKTPGFYQYQLSTSKDSPTGRWTLLIKSGDKRLQSYDFNVEDFLPERLALELKSHDTPLAPKDTMNIDVVGRYLYGAPANGNLLSGQVYVRPLRDAVPQLPGYEFGSATEQYLSQDLDITEFSLNKEGKGVIRMDSRWNDVRSPIKLIVQASLQESGGRPIVRRVVQPVWPSENLIGLRPLFDKEVDDGSNAEFDVVMTNVSGDKLAAKDLKVRFIHERRDYYWYYSSNDGWNSNFNQKDIIMDEQVIQLTKGSTARLSFPTDWGYYRLEIEDPVTGLISSKKFRAGHNWQENTSESGEVRPDQVKITLDKAAYKNGETAKITLTPPAAGNGYLMIESSEGVLWWQAIDVPATGKTIEIPINANWNRHDLYVSALVIRPGERKAGTTPKRAVGLLHLPLERKERQLALTLTVPDKMRPSQKLTVNVQALDASGNVPKQVNVLVAAVDVGILNITSYKTPDPFAVFFGRKAYGADQLDVYGQLIESAQGRLASLSFGGDAALATGGKRPDTSVTIVALQSQLVTLNDKGQGEVQLDIPDFNGELRIMAQAWTDNQFGMAEAKTVVAAPVVVELSTPRFLAGGDKSILALDINNLTDEPQTLTINVEADGFIKLVNNQPISLLLDKKQRKTVTLQVEALTGMGSGTVNLVVNGIKVPGETIAPLTRQWKIGTRPAYPAKMTTFQELLDGSPWNIPVGTMSKMELDGREGLLSLTTRPPIDLAAHIKALYAYPYGCAEQTVSGLYPSLYTNGALLQRLGLSMNQTDSKRREAIDVGISRLIGMQRYNGSFGLWSNNSSEGYWLTVYVTDFLLRAREQGYSVPDSVLNKANARLLNYLQNVSAIESYYADSDRLDNTRFAVQAYAGYVLARTKQAPLGALRTLYDRRDKAPSALSLAQLGIALKFMGDNSRADQALKEALIKPTRDARYWLADYGSALRDDALLLALLQENNLMGNQVSQKLFKLSQDITAKRWLSTQERNSIFLAAYPLINVPERPWQANVTVAGVNYSLSDKQSVLKLSDKEMKQIESLQINNLTPNVKLYQTMSISAYPSEMPRATSHNGLTISKDYLDMTGKPVNLSDVRSGDLLIVRLHVYATERIRDALVVDMLPAGLELENQNLASSSASLKDAAANIQNSLQLMQRAKILHQEFRDDRYVIQLDIGGGYGSSRSIDILYLARAVTPGSYRVPPAIVESMYRPNWQATSNAPSVLVVKPR